MEYYLTTRYWVELVVTGKIGLLLYLFCTTVINMNCYKKSFFYNQSMPHVCLWFYFLILYIKRNLKTNNNNRSTMHQWPCICLDSWSSWFVFKHRCGISSDHWYDQVGQWVMWWILDSLVSFPASCVMNEVSIASSNNFSNRNGTPVYDDCAIDGFVTLQIMVSYPPIVFQIWFTCWQMFCVDI